MTTNMKIKIDFARMAGVSSRRRPGNKFEQSSVLTWCPQKRLLPKSGLSLPGKTSVIPFINVETRHEKSERFSAVSVAE